MTISHHGRYGLQQFYPASLQPKNCATAGKNTAKTTSMLKSSQVVPLSLAETVDRKIDRNLLKLLVFGSCVTEVEH